MKNIFSITFIIFLSLICIQCGSSVDENNEFIITGTVVTAPNYEPIEGVTVSISNGTSMAKKTQTDVNGYFQISVNIDDINESYKLYLDYSEKNIQKIFDLKGFSLSHYDYGVLVLFNSENPHNLISFTYGGQLYFTHPGFETSSLSEAITNCINLEFMGYSDWILPTYDELYGMLLANVLEENKKVFWSSTIANKEEFNLYHSGLIAYCISMDPESDKLTTLRLDQPYPILTAKPIRYNQRPKRNYIISQIDARDRKNVKVVVQILGEDINNISEKGVCWATNMIPTKEDNFIECGKGNEEYSIILSELPQKVRVYIRPYYIKDNKIYYGDTLNTRND